MQLRKEEKRTRKIALLDDGWSDNTGMGEQCRRCVYRMVRGMIGQEEIGFDFYTCDIFPDDSKPNEYMRPYVVNCPYRKEE